MSTYSKSMFEKDLRKLKSLIKNYNKMNGGGYDVSPQPLAKGIHSTTVVGYVDDCAPTLSTLASEAKTGGGMLTGSVQTLCKILAPMGKKALATVATLLALNQVGKSQKGGGLVDGLASKLLPMSKTNLLVLVSLLLLNYFMHLQKKGSMKQRGGGMGALMTLLAPVGTNAFVSSLLLVLANSFMSKSKRRKRSQSGGSAMLMQLEKLLVPLGTSKFTVAALLVALSKLYKAKKGQKGGSMAELTALLAPKGLEVFLTSASLVALSKMNKKKAVKNIKKVEKKVKKTVKKVMKGGDCGCATPLMGGKMVEIKYGPTKKDPEGINIKFRKGGLHKSMGVPENYRFKMSQIEKWAKLPVGKTIMCNGKKVKITEKIRKQLDLAKTLMGFKKRGKSVSVSMKKGSKSKTHPGNKNFTTKKGNKDFHRKKHNVRESRKPYKRM